MPLMTIDDVMKDLRLKSRQSVYNLAASGELKILHLLISGHRGSPRIDADDLAAYKHRLHGGSGEGVTTSAAKTPALTATPRSRLKKSRPPRGPRLASIRHYE